MCLYQPIEFVFWCGLATNGPLQIPPTQPRPARQRRADWRAPWDRSTRSCIELGDVLTAEVSRNEKSEALGALRSVPNRGSVENALLGGVKDSDPAIRFDILGALLARGNIVGLQAAESALLSKSPDLPDYVLHNLRVGISEGVTQEEALPVLTNLLEAGEVETRRAAITAIMHVGTKKTVPPLKYALADPDREVRFDAVLGLARVTGQKNWQLNMDMFIENEAKYLTHWRNYGEPR